MDKCDELLATIEELRARNKALENALEFLAECSLSKSNCSSFTVANRRIRQIARDALNQFPPIYKRLP